MLACDAAKMTTSLLITVALIFVIVGAASIINRLWKPRQLVQEDEPAKIVDVAQIVTVKEFRSELYFFWFMFVIGTSLNTILTYASAETVLQEIAGLLLSIGNILFWGICIIVFTIEQKQTLYVYSETLTKLLDREERSWQKGHN